MPSQDKKTVLIIMHDWFLLDLYKTIFKIKGFEVIGVSEESDLKKKLETVKPTLFVLEKTLTPEAQDKLVWTINQKNIPVLLLTKKEEACNIIKGLKEGIYVYGDIMNDNISDIVKRGERLVEKWSFKTGSSPEGL